MEKIILVSRKFDRDCGSAEWIYADYLSEYLKSKGVDVCEVSQKIKQSSNNNSHKILNDLLILPIKLIYFCIFKGIKKVYFISENQAIYSGLLNFFGIETFVMFYDLIHLNNRGLRKFYFTNVYMLALRSKVIFCDSSLTLENIKKTYCIDTKKLLVIPPIYRKFNPAKKVKGEKVILGYIGSLGGRKRTELLLDLAEELRKSNFENFKIVVWGKGIIPKVPNNLKKLIKFYGYVREEYLERTYNSFDYLVFPSSEEGFGLPVIEAMMCGKPCFILEDGIFPKEVKKECYILKNIGQIPKKVLSLSNAEYLSKSRSVRNYAKGFDMEKLFDKTYKVLFKN
ncbi:glycosyltransferase [Candidatus Pacearchaeota archaeon]|nr:glycosyltransferase [Candidatus Pacearchaeota archaeon]